MCTPHTPGGTALASTLTFKCDPRRGIAVARDIKPSPNKGRMVTSSTDRIGTMKVEAVSVEWVETKTLSFIEAVRSEERRVGKECRCRWGPEHEKKKGEVERERKEGE